MKKIILILLCFSFLFSNLGCSPNDETLSSSSQNNIPSSSQNTIQRYEIELTLDNYSTYINEETTVAQYSPGIRFSGCLSYAFYKDVTFRIRNTNSNQEETIYCNAAGEGVSNMGGGSIEVIAVSGYVIFII